MRNVIKKIVAEPLISARKLTARAVFDKDFVIFGLLFLVGALIYANALNAPFIWDDLGLIVDNEQIKSFGRFKEWFTTSSTSGNVLESEADLYRPMMKFLFAVLYSIFGAIPAAFRALNIILHIVNSFFVFILCKKLKFPRYGGLLGALIFLVHPVQVEAVTYISGLPDVLAPFFILGGLILFKSGKNLTATAMCVLAFLSKEIAVTFFAFVWLIVIYDWKSYDKKTKKEKLIWASVFTVLAGVYIGLKLTVLNFAGSIHLTTLKNDYTDKTYIRIITFVSTLWDYFKLTFFPKDLFFEKIYLPVAELLRPRGIFGISIIVAGLALAYDSLRKNKKIFFTFFWFFIPLLPVSGIFIIANNLYTERWLYLPLIAISFGIAALWGILKTRRAKTVFACIIVSLGVSLSVRTVYRNTDWTNPQKFYEKEITYNPYSPRLFSQLGTIHFAKKNYNNAVRAFEKSVELDRAKSNPIYRFNLGTSYYYISKYDEAEYWLREALAMKPDYEKAKTMLDKTITDHEKFYPTQ